MRAFPLAIALLSLAVHGCAAPAKRSHPPTPEGFYRVPATPAEAPISSDTVMVRVWALSCANVDSPAARRLLEAAKPGAANAEPEALDPAAAADLLESLDSGGGLEVLGAPGITLAMGEQGIVRLAQRIESPGSWSDAQAQPTSLAPDECGFLFAVRPTLAPDAKLSLEIDYEQREMEGPSSDLRPSVTTIRVEGDRVVPNGGTCVLGGQRLVRRGPHGERSISTVLLVVNARTVRTPQSYEIPPVTPP